MRSLGGTAVGESNGIHGFTHYHDHVAVQVVVVLHQIARAELVPGGAVHPPPGQVPKGGVGAQGGPPGAVHATVFGLCVLQITIPFSLNLSFR